MTSFVLSTIAFFIATFYCRRYLDEQGIPTGMSRSVTVFCIAAAISYGVAFVVDHLMT